MARKRTKRAQFAEPNAEKQSELLTGLNALPPSEIVDILAGYRAEADMNRKGGPNPRDTAWAIHLDQYWNRYDFSKKAPWQAREVMPEVPMFVDRFAAAMREALTGSDTFFTVEAPNDNERDLANSIKKLLSLWLSRAGRDPLGHPVGFEVVFEELMKLGALMSVTAVVTPKGEGKNMYVAVEAYDPRNVWLDASGQNLYRIRRYEIDYTKLFQYARMEDGQGRPIYRFDQIELLVATIIQEMQTEREMLTGHGQQKTSTRKPIIIDEYLCTIITPDGRKVAENALCVVANERFLIRGPEPNPFWHGQDWVVAAPLVTAPLSAYGKAYVENFRTIASTFNELTNLILDGTFTTAMKAFAVSAEDLEDPAQIDEGIHPNKIFKVAQGAPKDFIQEIDLGELPQGAITVWQTLKKELQEAAAFNDISLGQFAPNSRTSASEIITAEQNSSALIRSIAKNVEQRILEPILNLVWKTGLQHMRADDAAAKAVVGAQMYAALYARRRELASMPITFRVRGISGLVARVQKLQSLINLLQTIGQSQPLMAALFQRIDPNRLIDLLFYLHDIDPREMEPSQRQQLIQDLVNAGRLPAPIAQAAAAGQPGVPLQPQVTQQAQANAASGAPAQ